MKHTIFWVSSLALLAIGCDQSAQDDNQPVTVTAQVDGITCPTCVPLLTAALKRRFEGAEIEVSDEKDTATVRFDSEKNFSEEAMRDAAAAVRMRVVSLHVERSR